MSDKKSFKSPSKAEREKAQDESALNSAVVRGDTKRAEEERERLRKKWGVDAY